MRIIVDAMGTDERPGPDVAGAVLAANQFDDTILLVGKKNLIERELSQHRFDHARIEIVDADEEILMTDKPSVVTKSKSGSSIHIGMRLVGEHQADAFVTAGNTGAVHAISMLLTPKRIPGVKRPALSSIFPINGLPVIFLDIGANTDSKAEWLAQFAVMGDTYAKRALGLEAPRVGLLSNGQEEGKGNQLILGASEIIHQLPLRHIGNVEPSDILNGHVDVVVCDGFIGNILLKTFEASTRYLTNVIRDELKADVFSTIGAMFAQAAFRRTRKRLDTFEIGGAPLLGVNGIVIVAHGSSNAHAIKNAIQQARKAVQGQVIEAIEANLVKMATL